MVLFEIYLAYLVHSSYLYMLSDLFFFLWPSLRSDLQEGVVYDSLVQPCKEATIIKERGKGLYCVVATRDKNMVA